MLETLRTSAARAARRSALGLIGILTLTVGLGFLTASLWIFLVTIADSLTAAVTVGSAYVGIGLILLALATARNAEPRSHVRAERPLTTRMDVLVGIAVAFLEGLGAGLGSRPRHSGRKRPDEV